MNRAFRIMVIEDSETQAFKLRCVLEEQGWPVSSANSAEAALAALTDPFPDLNRALESGADDFVMKSRDLAVLLARIRALIRRKFFQEENGRKWVST
jgi:DNA-binding response OmpR family regulator